MRNAAFSFRPISAKERAAILVERLKIVRARSDESVVQLSRRTNNVWGTDTTAKMNGFGLERALDEGKLIKIAISTPLR